MIEGYIHRNIYVNTMLLITIIIMFSLRFEYPDINVCTFIAGYIKHRVLSRKDITHNKGLKRRDHR